MEEFLCCLVILDAEHWVEIRVELPNNVLFIGCELICSVQESLNDGFLIL